MPEEALQNVSDAVQSATTDMAYSHAAEDVQLIADMQHLATYDEAIEKLRAKWGSFSGFAWVAVVGLGIIGIAAESNPAIFAAIALAVVAVFVTVKWRNYAGLDLPNERYEIAERTIGMIGRDCGGEPIHLHVDLAKSSNDGFVSDTYEQAPWTFTIYENEWLNCSGKLLDGTAFELIVTERVKKRAGWKRGSSGKMKHKTKLKNKHFAELRIKPRHKKHPRLGQAAKDAVGAVQLPKGEAISRGVRFHKGMLRLKTQLHCTDGGFGMTSLDPEGTGNVVAAMFLSLYQVIGLSTQLR